jgi:hypothetical protein
MTGFPTLEERYSKSISLNEQHPNSFWRDIAQQKEKFERLVALYGYDCENKEVPK